MISGANVLVTTTFDGAEHLLMGEKRYGQDAGLLVLPGGKSDLIDNPNDQGFLPFGLEPPVDTAVREVAEETGVVILPSELYFIGSIDYERSIQHDWCDEIDSEFATAIFRAVIAEKRARSFNLQPTRELNPEWFKTDDLPLERMQPDMQFWIKTALQMTRHDLMFGSFEYIRSAKDKPYSLKKHEVFINGH